MTLMKNIYSQQFDGIAGFVYIIAKCRDFVNNSHSMCRCQKHKCHMPSIYSTRTMPNNIRD